MGEPGGIASEITLKVWKKYRKSINPFVYIGNLNLLLKTNLLLKYNVPIKLINNINDSLNIFKNYLPVYEIKLKEKVRFGKTSQKNSSQSSYIFFRQARGFYKTNIFINKVKC